MSPLYYIYTLKINSEKSLGENLIKYVGMLEVFRSLGMHLFSYIWSPQSFQEIFFLAF